MRGAGIAVFCGCALFVTWVGVVVLLQASRTRRWGMKGGEVFAFLGMVILIVAAILDVSALLLVFG